MDRRNRKSIRLPDYDYSQPGYYFVTICTQNRKYLFGNIINDEMYLNLFGKIAEHFWLMIPERYPNVSLDEFIIMPNHIHGIIVIDHKNDSVGAIHELPLRYCRRNMLLPKIIGYFKMNSAKQINLVRSTSGRSVWQRNYYEHIIRNDTSLYEIRYYIMNNPIDWDSDEYNSS